MAIVLQSQLDEATRRRARDKSAPVPTIHIPGFDDIFKLYPSERVTEIEYNEHVALKKAGFHRRDTCPLSDAQHETLRKNKERAERMKESPTPELMEKIGWWMTKFDDAQDLLHTALWLGRPLVRKLGQASIPFIGWLLTIEDLLNLWGFARILCPPGMSGKRKWRRIRQQFSLSEEMRLRRFGRYIRSKTSFADIIQAAQATVTVFGVGICLGSIMGFVQEAFWGGMLSWQGQKVRVVGPPKDDTIWKAARFISDYSASITVWDDLTPEEHLHLIVAYEYAIDFIQEHLDTSGLYDQGLDKIEFVQPQLTVWNTITKDIMREAGIDPERDEPSINAHPGEQITLKEGIERSYVMAPSWIDNMGRIFEERDESQFVASHITEMAEKLGEVVEKEKNIVIRHSSVAAMVTDKIVEWGLWGLFRFQITQQAFYNFIEYIRLLMKAQVSTVPTREMIQRARNIILYPYNLYREGTAEKQIIKDWGSVDEYMNRLGLGAYGYRYIEHLFSQTDKLEEQMGHTPGELMQYPKTLTKYLRARRRLGGPGRDGPNWIELRNEEFAERYHKILQYLGKQDQSGMQQFYEARCFAIMGQPYPYTIWFAGKEIRIEGLFLEERLSWIEARGGRIAKGEEAPPG